MKKIYLSEVDSTNLYAKSNIENLADKSIVHAANQTAGRGRLQRTWVNLGEGNLFLTFVLKPSNSFNEVYSNLTQYLSVVLCKILEEYGLKPQIKWPNDVLINGKKIAGILSETVMQGSLFKGLVLGIGVNLNTSEKDLASIIDKEATSLNLEISKSVDVNLFLDKLAEEFFADYDNFLQKGFELIKNDYISRTCFLDTEICVQVFNDKKCGIAKAINDKGELVMSNNQKEFVLTIGDIL
ncbi:TPA: biotin--[acetyl-CoA-carboxylase] ligase [Candidatus Gastranaerophilales bacterium HUM_20]|nr:biotin/acetyl-CoA-carboxylase ligase [Clostridium sp. CAG:729]DAB19367.1 MAG TPA: biotin--[acetyl-CoA-carboxylase] ligase [Candidatus Gastranaerophilales bacterium HUM_20]